MELYSGTLYDVITMYQEQRLTIPCKNISHYLREIAKGLHYLHNQDPPIIHRDLKVTQLVFFFPFIFSFFLSFAFAFAFVFAFAFAFSFSFSFRFAFL